MLGISSNRLIAAVFGIIALAVGVPSVFAQGFPGRGQASGRLGFRPAMTIIRT